MTTDSTIPRVHAPEPDGIRHPSQNVEEVAAKGGTARAPVGEANPADRCALPDWRMLVVGLVVGVALAGALGLAGLAGYRLGHEDGYRQALGDQGLVC